VRTETMWNRVNPKKQSTDRSLPEDRAVDLVLEALASSARPDPSGMERGDDPAVDEILETLAGSARPDLSRLRRGVERRLASGQNTRPTPVPWAQRKHLWAFGLTAACLVGLALTLVLRDSHPPAIVLLAVDGVSVTEEGRVPQQVVQSEPVRLGATIRSEKEGMGTLLLSDLSCVRIAQSTSLRLVNRRDLSLEHGSVFAVVSPQTGSGQFRIRAGEVLVTVQGTSFEVTRAEGVVSVAVEKGTVRVEAGGSSVRLHGGQAVRIDDGKMATRWQTDPAAIAPWRQRLLEAEANDLTFVQLMRKHLPSRALDL